MKTRNIKLAILIAVVFIDSFSAFSADYNILNFGAFGDGKTLNTKSIQAELLTK